MEFSSNFEVFVVLAVWWFVVGVNKYNKETGRDIDEITTFARSKFAWLFVPLWPLFTLLELVSALLWVTRPRIMFRGLKSGFSDLLIYVAIGA